jgi:hypothetical protein
MSSLREIDLSLIDEIFRGPDKGHVLDFSNRTFTDFFAANSTSTSTHLITRSTAGRRASGCAAS